MKATVHAAYYCECGGCMMNCDRPYRHLMHCMNPECKHYGVFYEIPRVELIAGRAFQK